MTTSLGPQLATLASAAFQSHVRAYACHSRETRHIFHPRSLHLGHLAKAFALQEPPTRVMARARTESAPADAASAEPDWAARRREAKEKKERLAAGEAEPEEAEASEKPARPKMATKRNEALAFNPVEAAAIRAGKTKKFSLRAIQRSEFEA